MVDDRVIEQLAVSNASIAKSMEGIHGVLKEINDSHIVHVQENKDSHSLQNKVYGKLLWLFGLALVILAGASAAIKLM